MWQGLLRHYRSYLPLTDDTPLITLLEGNTPLIYAERLSDMLEAEVYFKFEGLNPTGSFKDRGMVMAVAKAMEQGSRTIMCASTGNTSASAAAYAARAGLRCIVLIPNKKIAVGKLAQAVIYGAEVIAIDGNFDQALKFVREITSSYPITLVNSVNPYRIEGQKTAAFEVCDALGEAPDILAIPVGNAGNIAAYWKGFKEYRELGKTDTLPKMWGFEAEGAAAITKGQVIEHPETVATAIRIGNPASWEKAAAAATESAGFIGMVSDEDILEAYRFMAAEEGVFAEPASAASVAGVLKQHREGKLQPGDRVVCVITGNGLKDPDTAIDAVSVTPKVVSGNLSEVLQAIGVERGDVDA